MLNETNSAGKTIGPTRGEIEKLKGVPKKNSWIRNKIVRYGLSLAALGGLLGGVVYEAYQHDMIPGVHRTPETPALFDNSKSNGTISSDNTIIISLENIKDVPTIPEGDNPQHTINLLCPIRDIAAGEKIQYEKRLVEYIPHLIEYPGEYVKEYDVKNEIIFKGVPEGKVIVAPVDGQVLFHSNAEGKVSGLNLFYGNFPKEGFYQIDIASLFGFFEPLIEPNLNSKGDSISAISVKRGQPIMITATQKTTFFLLAKDRLDAKLILPADTNLITQFDSIGQEKLVIAEHS